MRARVRSLLGLLIVGALVLSGTSAPARQAAQDPPRTVVLITVDGFAAFHLDNPGIDLPNIRALADAGVRARSETVFPSLTHPAHTTLVTGVEPRRHGVVGNRVVDQRTGQRFHITNLPRRESIRVPTIFDAVHASGRRTAAFFWPETLEDGSIDDNVPEVFAEGGGPKLSATSPELLQELRDAGIPIDSYADLYDDPFTQGAADVVLTRAAAHVLKTRRPALLALHLLVTDKAQHAFGPAHYLARAALTTADTCIGMLRQAVREAGMEDRTTFVIAADHGFVTVREEVNLLPVLDNPALKGRVRWHEDGWYVWGELLPEFESGRDGPALERVLARALATPGVSRIVRPGEFEALGFPEYEDNHLVRGSYLIAGDINTRLALDESDRSTKRRPRARPYHGHGYFPEHPVMHTALILSGAGIVQGRTLSQARNVDVAPTIAQLLGVELPSATGRVLTDALAH